MEKEINKPITSENKVTKQNEIKETTNHGIIKTMNDIPEEAKLKIKIFLEKMGQIQIGKDNGAKKIQEKFCKSDEYIRGSKDIIKKLRGIRYEDYSVWGKYMGIHTYNYKQEIVQYILPDLLNDKEFMLELIKDNPDVSKYLGICLSNHRDHPLHKQTWKYENMTSKLIEGDIPTTSNLIKDKEFILSVISMVSSDCLSSLYCSIPKNSPLREDKEIINAMLDSGGDSTSGAAETIKTFLEQKESDLLDDREIMKKIVAQIGGYNRHKHHPKIKDDEEYLTIVYKGGGARSFYSFDNDFKNNNPEYYNNLVQKAESLIANNEQELVNNIEKNPLLAKTFNIDAIIDKIDEKLINNNVFVTKLFFADSNLYDKIKHPQKQVLKYVATYLKQKSAKWSEAVCDGTVDIDSGNGVMSYTCGTVKLGNVCEYGNNVIVWYNGREQREHVVYRAARNDDSGDNRGLCFTTTKIKSVESVNNNVIITVEASSKTDKRIYRFSFPKISIPKED